ncbi:MAG: hypothetical protein R8F63_01595 [Acidimicrobiales bacterium]|nr:hypothetical protein [Acidimicrobiales bacterium]
MLHFAILRTAGEVDAAVREVLDAPRPPTRRVGGEHLFRLVGEGTAIALWSDYGRPWASDDEGVTAMVGSPRLIGTGAEDLLDRLAVDGPGGARRFDGRFTVLRLESDGGGWLRSDRFGLSPVYRGMAGETEVLSNRPAIVARLIEAAAGRRVARDRATAMSVAVLGTALGDESGFEGICRVPDRHDVDLPTRGPSADVETWPHMWADDGAAIDGSPVEIVTAVTDRLVASARQLALDHGGVIDAELTGGRDSRLMLALFRLAGVEDRVRFHTFGDPGASDARVARYLAESFDLDWEMRRARQHELSVEGFVRRVSNLSGEFGAGGIIPPEAGTILCSGMLGEALSAKYRNSKPATVGRATARLKEILVRSQPFTKRSTVRAVMSRVTEGVVESADAGCPPRALLDAFYLRERERRWIGSRPDRWDRNVFPLYSPDAIIANMRLPVDDRHGERIHSAIIAAAGLPNGNPDEELPRAPDAPPLADLGGLRWADVLVEMAHETRASPMSECIDTRAVVRAAENLAGLGRVERQQLLDALTALAWMTPGLIPAYFDN